MRKKMIDSCRLSVIQYYGAVGCRQVVRHETLTLALRWFDPSHPSQKSPRMKFGEVFTFSLFTLHFSLNPLHRTLFPFRCCVRTWTHEKGFLRLPESNRFCGWIRTRESAKFDCYQFVESISRSAVFLSKLIARLKLKNGKIYGIIK